MKKYISLKLALRFLFFRGSDTFSSYASLLAIGGLELALLELSHHPSDLVALVGLCLRHQVEQVLRHGDCWPGAIAAAAAAVIALADLGVFALRQNFLLTVAGAVN